jgi:hypothetical protein
VNSAELQFFYQELVRKLRDRGVVCAITSGLACVYYGLAETTKDCDLLCHAGSFDQLLEMLETTHIDGAQCRYRGNISPPLDARWHRGGWTSHFEWFTKPDMALLDVFGRALRESSPWEEELIGLYAGPQTVAEMKRTNRDKDWSFITALGVRMIESGDDRGWLNIFNKDTLAELLVTNKCPPAMTAQRPALRLATEGDARMAGALSAERRFWEELDRGRIQILEGSLRPYVSAVRKARSGREVSLREDHAIRIECATKHLAVNPLGDYGVWRYIAETKESLVQTAVIPGEALTWLPDVTKYFKWLL